MKFNFKKQALALLAVCTAVLALSACGGKNDTASADSTAQPAASEDSKPSEGPTASEEQTSGTEPTSDEVPKVSTADTNIDIDLDKLNNSVDAIKNLDINTDVSIHGSSSDTSDSTKNDDTKKEENTAETPAKTPAGDKTVYSYTDVYRSGNALTVIPNGGLNASTVLYGGKDLNGFLDYIDSEVLVEGRKINRPFFYDILSTMLVDKKLSSDIESIEKNMIMALAMADNFYAMDVRINECYLDANNAADYNYKLTAYGKDDTWIVNYGNRTLYMNNGKTQYFSQMFEDKYLAAWMVAIEDYYGIK